MGARDYSTTAASNLSVGGISIAEGMSRASVNNAIRQELADIANLLLDQGGAVTTAGAANAYTLALPSAPAALADNLLFLATSHASNTGASTMNVGGTGVKDIKKLAGGSPVTLGSQDFRTGHIGIFIYSSGNNCFLLLNPGTALLVGAESTFFETRATAVTAASAGTIPDSVDVVEVLGNTFPGDDVNLPYVRVSSDPGTGDRFADVDGTWWTAAAQGLQRIDGIAALRNYPAIAGRSVFLTYHTTAGDFGSGEFYAVTGLPPGFLVDDDGTVIVPTGGDGSSAWARLWDGVTAHVGWFGAVCDRVTDDYVAVRKCMDLFARGRAASRSGIIDVGPGFAFGTPLIWADNNTGTAFKWKGGINHARGSTSEPSYMKYIGPVAEGAIFFYGGAEIGMDDIQIAPGNARNGLVLTTANTFVSTLTAPVVAGDSAAVLVSTATLLQGAFLAVDDGDNFEIIRVKNIVGTTIVAEFAKAHAIGTQVGLGAGLFSMRFNRCRFQCPASPVYTTTTTNNPGGGVQIFTPASMTGIEAGMPLRIGRYDVQEIVYVTSVTATTFTATCGQSHTSGDLIMYPTAGIYMGNRISITVQVSEGSFNECVFAEEIVDRGYAGIRQVSGGNTKNFSFTQVKASALEVAFAFDQSNGAYQFFGVITAGIHDTIFVFGSCMATIVGLEDESNAYWVRASAGSAAVQTTFVGCQFSGNAPQANGEIVGHSGQLTFIGCYLRQANVASTQIPIIIMNGISTPTLVCSLVLINSHIAGLAMTPTTTFVRSAPASAGGGIDVIAAGTAPVTLINCKGGVAGSAFNLPDLFPPYNRWEGRMVYDPPSLLAGALDTVQTLVPTPTTGGTVVGAVLGDLVSASFSLDLQGTVLRAWVSAADTVKFQFSNPTAGVVDLGSGTVKCRVIK